MLYSGEAFRLESLPNDLLKVVFDLKDQSANVFNAKALKELAEVLEVVKKQKAKGLLFSSGKPGGFVFGADITEFYPPEDASTEDQDKIVSEVTDKYCLKCPVRTLCYDFAKETNSVGIWGCTFFPYDGTLPSDPEEEDNVR